MMFILWIGKNPKFLTWEAFGGYWVSRTLTYQAKHERAEKGSTALKDSQKFPFLLMKTLLQYTNILS